MTDKLLTIGVPTYNRAERFDRQMAWLARELEGHEDLCEVVVSNNCSTDGTAETVARWQERLGPLVHAHHATENTGPLGNIAYCLRAARGRFAWVIGDDDDIEDGTLAFVLATLREQPELVSVALEFVTVGARPLGPCFGFPATAVVEGRELVERALERQPFGLAFMTAHVYRTEFAQRALDAWPDGPRNLDFQLFMTAFVAACGPVLVTHEPHVQYVTGENVYEKDAVAVARIAGDTAEAFVRLASLGYSRAALGRQLVRLRHNVVAGFRRSAREQRLKAVEGLVRYGVSLARLWAVPTRPPFA